jgi:hypothetical protein
VTVGVGWVAYRPGRERFVEESALSLFLPLPCDASLGRWRELTLVEFQTLSNASHALSVSALSSQSFLGLSLSLDTLIVF